ITVSLNDLVRSHVVFGFHSPLADKRAIPMGRVFLTMLATGILVVASGCGDSHESITRDSMRINKEVAELLSKVSNSDDFERIKGQLRPLLEQEADLPLRA